MPRTYPDALSITRKVLQVLIILNLLLGVLILTLLLASLAAEVWVTRALGLAPAAGYRVAWGMRTVMMLGLVGVPVTNAVLRNLGTIVDTVGHGDAFVVENAGRLKTIAWALLGLEVLRAAVGAVAAAALPQADGLAWSPSVTPWLSVLLLFVLARVFEQGARMRDDLEGTV